MTCKVCNGTGRIPVIGKFTNPCECSKPPIIEAKTKQARPSQDCQVDNRPICKLVDGVYYIPLWRGW